MAARNHQAAQIRRLASLPDDGAVRVGIVGGGLTGMALARRLAVTGCRPTVLERDRQVGGLATWHDYGPFVWDRFYHVILPTDQNLIGFVDDLGLSGDLNWRRTYTGFYVDRQLHSISNNMEFLKFPLLSLPSKLRLAWTMFYGSKLDDWRKLEKISLEDWLVRQSGRQTYEKLWKPLLLAKLGESHREVSAVFIWSYIKRLFSARHSAASKEQLGHVSGGYRAVFERICRQIAAAGGSVQTGVRVDAIRASGNDCISVSTDVGEQRFDRVVCTSPVPVLTKLVEPGLLEVTEGSRPVQYLAVICVVLVTSKPLVPYYVVNIADREIPFTGMIGMTNAVALENTAGRHVTYLPKYLLPSDELFEQPDSEIEARFMEGVRRMLPDFDPGVIESIHVNRATRVQPLQVLGYSDIVPSVSTRHPSFFVLNTAQFLYGTLNNNEVIGAVNRFCDEYGASLMRPRVGSAAG